LKQDGMDRSYNIPSLPWPPGSETAISFVRQLQNNIFNGQYLPLNCDTGTCFFFRLQALVKLSACTCKCSLWDQRFRQRSSMFSTGWAKKWTLSFAVCGGWRGCDAAWTIGTVETGWQVAALCVAARVVNTDL